MTTRVDDLALQYAVVLQRYLSGESEHALEQAYELAREALNSGIGLLEMAAIHSEVMSRRMSAATTENRQAISAAAADIFATSLSPFEMTHRGFHEASETSRRHEAAADLSQLGLSDADRSTLFSKAAALIAQCFNAEYTAILEPGDGGLVLRASIGWSLDAFPGEFFPSIDTHTGYTLAMGEPVIIDDLQTETRFTGHSLLRQHGIVSGICVALPALDQPPGVITVHSSRRHTFNDRDVHFLQTMANVLATALERRRAAEDLRQTVLFKDELLTLMPAGVYSCDADGRITSYNERAAELWGRRPRLQDPGERYCGSWRLYRLDGSSLPHDECPMSQVLRDGRAVQDQEVVIERSDGSRITVLVNVAALRDSHAKPAGAISCFLDITMRKRAETRERLLAEAGKVLTQSLDYRENLRSVAQLAVERLAGQSVADWCVVDALQENGELERVAIVAGDPAMADVARRLQEEYPLSPSSRVWKAMEETEPIVLDELSDDLLAESARDDEHLALLRTLNIRSAMSAPLRVRDRPLGLLSFVSTDPAHIYGPDDLTLAVELAGRCSMAVDNSLLYGQAEEHRRALQTVLDSITEGVISVDVDRRVVRANICAGRMLGIMPRALHGHPLETVMELAGEDGAPLRGLAGQINRCIENDEPVYIDEAWLAVPAGVESTNSSGEHPGERLRTGEEVSGRLNGALGGHQPAEMADAPAEGPADGDVAEKAVAVGDGRRRVPVAITLAPRHASGGAPGGAVVLFRDITRRREMDDLRENIISLVSHELRTPLVHIKGFASSLLESDIEWDEDTRLDFIRTIDREADRLAKLIDDLLEMSRLANGKLLLHLRRVRPEGLINAAIQEAAPLLERHRLELDLPDRLPSTPADDSMIQAVLVNLLGNAAKYSRPGSRITVGARPEESELIVWVADEGPGIPEESRQMIFEKFTRLQHPDTKDVPGTGLGLALCKAVIESHGGQIWVDGRVGEGSTFYFKLPLTAR